MFSSIYIACLLIQVLDMLIYHLVLPIFAKMKYEVNKNVRKI